MGDAVTARIRLESVDLVRGTRNPSKSSRIAGH
jgi:hypothetical protein